METEFIAVKIEGQPAKCGYCGEPLTNTSFDKGQAHYHCELCEIEGKAVYPEQEWTVSPCGHRFRIGTGKPFVMNP